MPIGPIQNHRRAFFGTTGGVFAREGTQSEPLAGLAPHDGRVLPLLAASSGQSAGYAPNGRRDPPFLAGLRTVSGRCQNGRRVIRAIGGLAPNGGRERRAIGGQFTTAHGRFRTYEGNFRTRGGSTPNDRREFQNDPRKRYKASCSDSRAYGQVGRKKIKKELRERSDHHEGREHDEPSFTAFQGSKASRRTGHGRPLRLARPHSPGRPTPTQAFIARHCRPGHPCRGLKAGILPSGAGSVKYGWFQAVARTLPLHATWRVPHWSPRSCPRRFVRATGRCRLSEGSWHGRGPTLTAPPPK